MGRVRTSQVTISTVMKMKRKKALIVSHRRMMRTMVSGRLKLLSNMNSLNVLIEVLPMAVTNMSALTIDPTLVVYS